MNGLFGINGLMGYVIGVLLVVVLAVIFGCVAVSVQKANATHYYQITDYNAIKANDANNKRFFQDAM